MIKFYKPVLDSDHKSEYARFVDCHEGAFDIMTFWRGEQFDGTIPNYVRLLLEDGPLGDFMHPIISWDIFSDRAAQIIARRAGDAVQFFDAPLYRHSTGESITGYKILNATQAIPCLDWSKAKVRRDPSEPDRITSVLSWAFDEAIIPSDLHVFRAAEYPVARFFSKHLSDDLFSGSYLKDLAFLEIGGEETVTYRRRRPRC